MRTWKLTLEYGGTRYSGWQKQKNARTVMGWLRRAAEGYFHSGVDIQGAGRTGAGVHAALPRWPICAIEAAANIHQMKSCARSTARFQPIS